MGSNSALNLNAALGTIRTSTAQSAVKAALFKVTDPGVVKGGDVKYLPLSDLTPFRNHPFKVLENADFDRLVESISENGVLIPAIARPMGDEYELIAGHRRKAACEKLGLETMPVLVRDLSDEEAVIAMVDSNVQRENILPSEKAFAYKMKLEAMNRQAGRPSIKNGSQVGNHFNGRKSAEILADEAGESKNQIFRYIRLTELIPSLLDMVDDGTISFTVAVELSYVSPENQEAVRTEIAEYRAKLNAANVSELKKSEQAGLLNAAEVRKILTAKKNDRPQPVKISGAIVAKYNLPDDAAEREKIIDNALEKYFEENSNEKN